MSLFTGYDGPWADYALRKTDLRDPPKKHFIRLEGPPSVFWSGMANEENLQKYRAVNGKTKCNIFLGRMVRIYFGDAVYARVFSQGMASPNRLFRYWKKNNNLVRLYPEYFSIQDIQDLASDGYVILLAYRNSRGPGHVAFVGSIDLQLNTIPPLVRLEGRDGRSLGTEWLPLVVQAGTYTGITSMAYASNGWLRKDLYAGGTVCYYLIKQYPST